MGKGNVALKFDNYIIYSNNIMKITLACEWSRLVVQCSRLFAFIIMECFGD